MSWRGTGYGSIVHVVEHEHFNNNEQLFHRVVVCAIRRFRILSEWTGSDGVTWAKVRTRGPNCSLLVQVLGDPSERPLLLPWFS